ncbi:hypothetical protein [Nostoc sp.]|uniref:hypothetical protein n=1 Tax=Nostoc sp. TaxID=1180 RepID=UPI002FFBD804
MASIFVIEEGRRQRAEGLHQLGIPTPPEQEPLNSYSVGVLNPCSQLLETLRERSQQRSGVRIPFCLLPSASCLLPFFNKWTNVRELP